MGGGSRHAHSEDSRAGAWRAQPTPDRSRCGGYCIATGAGGVVATATPSSEREVWLVAQHESAGILEVRFASLGLLKEGGDITQAPLESGRGEDGTGAGDFPGSVGDSLGFVDGEGGRHTG